MNRDTKKALIYLLTLLLLAVVTLAGAELIDNLMKVIYNMKP